jgi:hypothetical protein
VYTFAVSEASTGVFLQKWQQENQALLFNISYYLQACEGKRGKEGGRVVAAAAGAQFEEENGVALGMSWRRTYNQTAETLFQSIRSSP